MTFGSNAVKTDNMTFTAQEWLRYTRHIQQKDIGPQGQKKLKNSHVIIVGMGGLGCPAAQYLAAAGVGQLTLIDADTVDLSNLQRQVIYSMEDIGRAKVDAAATRLQGLNPDIHVIAKAHALSLSDLPVFEQADIVLDCTDNYSARSLINTLCIKNAKAWCYAGVHDFSAQLVLFEPDNACYHCLFPEQPAVAIDCNSEGILGAVPGLIGTMQALEVLKFLLDLPVASRNALVQWDLQTLSHHRYALQKDISCVACRQDGRASVYAAEGACAVTSPYTITVQELAQWSGVLWDIRSLEERACFHLDSAFFSDLTIDHVPMNKVIDTLEELDKALPIALFCQSGARSDNIASVCYERGWQHVKSVHGGLPQLLRHGIGAE